MPDQSIVSIGKVMEAQGDVQARSGEALRPLSVGDDVFQGDTLVTGEEAGIYVQFNDQTRLSVGAQSEISLEQYIYDADDASRSNLLFEMSTGLFRTVTGEIADQNPDHFKLRSPLATIGIRGHHRAQQCGQWGRTPRRLKPSAATMFWSFRTS